MAADGCRSIDMLFRMFRPGGCCQRPQMPEWLVGVILLFLLLAFGGFVYLIVITVF